MPIQAIPNEVDQIHNVSARLEELAEQHPPVSEPLMKIAVFPLHRCAFYTLGPHVEVKEFL
jgi:hypothetical protein